ncbi:uncharacterized protein LOC120348824 [Nilaparvata lugens]|uniref:uncharacterized protein LOC120348824 n=1 Tax=Nilaparvata lugens TaxID=108931 RepID=UPI00193D7910|nr:uncharacterized protein LOC120348824 [Nilaparvata lugens]
MRKFCRCSRCPDIELTELKHCRFTTLPWWIRKWPATSGAAVLEVDIPTGYSLVESEAERLSKSGVHPSLRDAKIVDGKTVWFFDHVDRRMRCFNHTVRRWFPVANMTLHRQAIIYEITARETFEQILVNSTPLYILNICEVCGSYQCPYCPYYNKSTLPAPQLAIILAAMVRQICCFFMTDNKYIIL